MALVIEDLVIRLFDELESLIDPWNRPTSYQRDYLPQPPTNRIITDHYDLKFIWDIGFKIKFNMKISSKQADLLVKVLSKQADFFEKVGYSKESLDFLFENPVFRNPPYESMEIKREVRYIGNGRLAFRSLYNPKIVNDIRKIQGKESANYHKRVTIYSISSEIPEENPEDIYFVGNYRIWVIEVTESNMNKVMRLIKGFAFEFDSDVENFFLNAENTKTLLSAAVIDQEEMVINTYNDRFLSSWLEEVILMEED